MTCIVGISAADKVVLAGDSIAAAGGIQDRMCDPKVFKLGEYLMGYTSSFRFGQVLKYEFTPPKYAPHANAQAFMVREFVPALRALLKEHGWATKDKDQESSDGTFLVGFSGGLFMVQADYSVTQSCRGYASVGSGREVALGALHVLVIEQGGPDPVTAAKLAVEAAIEHCTTVAGPVHVVQLPIP